MFGFINNLFGRKSDISSENIVTNKDTESFALVEKTDLPTNQTVSSRDLAYSAANLAYKTLNKEKFTGAELNLSAKLVGTGWEVLNKSADYSDTKVFSYTAVTFINRVIKEIHSYCCVTKHFCHGWHKGS